MNLKRNIIILCIITFCLTAFYFWDNILILDDYHPDSYNTVQTDDSPNLQPSEETTDEKSAHASNTKKGYSIYINLDECLLYLYKDEQLIKTYPVSGGKQSTPSPEGTWKIISKDNWGEGFGGSWMGFNVPWGKYGIHGTVYPWFVGKSNASKGCIRMKNKDVAELYKMVPHGTLVTIVQNNKPFRIMKNGDVGSDVLTVQKALKELGYFKGYAGGKFGTELANSVKKFQKENKIKVSGKVTNQTYTLIMEKLRLLREEKNRETNENTSEDKPSETTPQENQ